MKTRKMFAVVLAVICFIMALTGCASAPAVTAYDTGVTNELEYSNYEFWEKNNTVRLVVDITMHTEGDVEREFSEVKYAKLPKSNAKTIETLKEGMISFFQERYNIDISEKLANQEVRIFSSTGINEGVMGYVEIGKENVLNLNQRLFKDYSDVFETTYVHETLHQIGFQGEESLQVVEGITDALADMIMCYIGMEPVLTPDYYECRTIGYQLLAADPEIVSCYLEDDDFDILERINEKLKDVKQPFRKAGHFGKLLENRLQILFSIATGTAWGFSTDPYLFAYEVQEIVKAYCQEFNPDADTIDYIRNHYLVLDYEGLSFVEEGEGYRYYTE